MIGDGLVQFRFGLTTKISVLGFSTVEAVKGFGDGTKIDTRRFWGIRFNVSAYATIKKTYPEINLFKVVLKSLKQAVKAESKEKKHWNIFV